MQTELNDENFMFWQSGNEESFVESKKGSKIVVTVVRPWPGLKEHKNQQHNINREMETH